MKTKTVKIKCSVCDLLEVEFTEEEAKDIKKITCVTCKEK